MDSIVLIISDILFDGYLIGFIQGKYKSTVWLNDGICLKEMRKIKRKDKQLFTDEV